MNKMWLEVYIYFRGFEEVAKIANEVAALARVLDLDSVGSDHVTELLESIFSLLQTRNWKIWL
jgi:Tfp pilus assembly protein PilO